MSNDNQNHRYGEGKSYLVNWSIIVNMAPIRDHLAIYGLILNHPRLGGEHGIPGTFVSFDRETMTGVSLSGRTWKLDRHSFEPNGNASTLEDALDFIEKNWTKNKEV